jgi:hypothetical protein
MDERVEAFLADVLALEGDEANAIRQGVRGALADYEQLFRAQEVNCSFSQPRLTTIVPPPKFGLKLMFLRVRIGISASGASIATPHP